MGKENLKKRRYDEGEFLIDKKKVVGGGQMATMGQRAAMPGVRHGKRGVRDPGHGKWAKLGQAPGMGNLLQH